MSRGDEWWAARVSVLLKACETSWLPPDVEVVYRELLAATKPAPPPAPITSSLSDVTYLVVNGETHWTLRYNDGTTKIVVTPGVQQNESGHLGIFSGQ